jgi:transcriptional regulator with XRE-family HTH domain
MDIKDELKSRRQELGLTLKDVSDEVGVSEGTISRWESGDIQNMRRDRIMAYAKALKISPAVVMGWPQKPRSRELQEDEEQLIEKYEQMTLEGKRRLQERADEILKLGYTIRPPNEQ